MDISFFLSYIDFTAVSSTLDELHPSDMSGFLCTLHKEACSTNASVSVEISFLSGSQVREFPTSLERTSYSDIFCNSDWTLQNASTPSHLKGIVFKKNYSTNISYAYLSISDGFVHQFFFCLAVWLQLETRYTSPKAGSKESKTTPSSFHLLTNTEFQHAFSIQK